MMVHHAQAVQMAETVRKRTNSEEIRVLATDVVLTQQAEIGQMRGWLDVWGLPAAGGATGSAMAWMGHPSTGTMPGMATPEDLARLQQASPEEADEQFLRLMIPHHQAAVVMAEAILERSDRPEVQRLAQKIIASQQEEIRGMQALLQRKGLSPVEGEPNFGEDTSHDEHTKHAYFSEDLPGAGRLALLPLAIFAMAWLCLDALRRRLTGTRLAGSFAPPASWRMAAVGGLLASAALHAGLAPEHFEEAYNYGVFFAAASIVAATTAAAILAWPSRPVYIAGAGVALTLIVLWGVFRLVPLPGAGVVEEVDLVGLSTKATELVAMTACTALWFCSRRIARKGVQTCALSEKSQ
ncbi:MAG: DUF305 domain-containing protein [Rubrobacter sp.]|nr:DUF305 domain-containing protein [Rubrobacter sp.]